MTVEQFAALPGAAGWRYELHEGSLIAMPGPGAGHMIAQTNCYRIIDRFLMREGLGMLSGTGCYNLPLPGTTEELLCPDLSFVTPDRLAAMPRRGSYLVGAPDLVLEIASPSDTRAMLANKAGIYLRAGVRLIWVLWLATRSVDCWLPAQRKRPSATLAAGATLSGEPVIPGFACAVTDLFAGVTV